METMSSPITDTVYLVYGDKENHHRYLQGVYRSRANAVAAIWDMTNDVSDGPEGSEEWDHCYHSFEIVEMSLD